jgi:hypothetical protein
VACGHLNIGERIVVWAARCSGIERDLLSIRFNVGLQNV